VPNFEQPKCFINTSPQQLVHDKMQYLRTIADAAFEILKEKFQYVFDQLEPESKQYQAVKVQFVSYLQEHIVFGFNSSSYDIPLVKAHLMEYLLYKIKFVILKGKSFTCLTTAKLKFLDIKNYIALGFDYAKFIKAYEMVQQNLLAVRVVPKFPAAGRVDVATTRGVLQLFEKREHQPRNLRSLPNCVEGEKLDQHAGSS